MCSPLEGGFRRAVLDFLVKERAIFEELRSRMLGWRHSGFSVHNQVRVAAEDPESGKKLAGTMLRAPLSLAKMSYDTASGTVIYRSKMHLGLKRNFQVMPGAEWLELLCKHIPDRYEHLVRYCDWYSNRSRGAQAAKVAVQGTIASGITEGLSEVAQRAKATWARLSRPRLPERGKRGQHSSSGRLRTPRTPPEHPMTSPIDQQAIRRKCDSRPGLLGVRRGR
jgi:hypothetical protein